MDKACSQLGPTSAPPARDDGDAGFGDGDGATMRRDPLDLTIYVIPDVLISSFLVSGQTSARSFRWLASASYCPSELCAVCCVLRALCNVQHAVYTMFSVFPPV